MENTKAPKCNSCRSSSEVVRIVFGRPGQEAQRLQKEGKVVFGGCRRGTENWRCKKCGNNLK